MCGLGVIITFGTYAIARPGGVYILTIGLIIGGGVMFLKGLANML